MEQELNQTGETTEQPKEEISKETPKVVSAETKTTSERPRTEDEFRKIQSLKDKADARLTKVESELQGLRKANEQQRLLQRQREISDLEGDTDGQAKIRKKHQLEDELSQLQDRREKEEGAVARKYDQAMDLAKEHNLSLSEARELLEATTPKEMELMAQLKAREKEKLQIKVEEPAFKADSGSSDAGGESDEAFMKRYSEGKSDDHKRAKKILSKMK
ncbi:MAG: hypothetical protein MUP81_04460 [Dehalococcoidia bacterium]|nr:hypothetical protein [Dehalococcoidia bacterium]